MLREDLRAPREQRHTVKRIFDRLIDEHGMTDVSYGYVRMSRSGNRRSVRARAECWRDVFVPHTHRPRMEAVVKYCCDGQ
ncbi:hypothetical protein GCM10010178_40000 [Lentzea flava]|uniref:Transposase n=1 Tax=Lentzea flava TaxID=103732 RepID=A0ABQ2ULE5_9PSEU|nr:hypothetical protein [Lentzea flava]GGU43476.1 hypothetical protein GCM10010178_40000 [Lentzea flava]